MWTRLSFHQDYPYGLPVPRGNDEPGVLAKIDQVQMRAEAQVERCFPIPKA
jgi:hypothetical protein